MPDLEVGGPKALAQAEQQLDQLRRDFSVARRQLSEAEAKAAKAQEQNRLLGERLGRLEALVQSAFARSVRTLSASRGQLGRSAEADRVVQLVEEHVEATQFLDAARVPGSTLLQRLRWLYARAVFETEVDARVLRGVDLGSSSSTVLVEVHGDAVPTYDSRAETIPAPALPPKP